MPVSALILLVAIVVDPQFVRLAEEAEAFAAALPNLIGEERLRQRALPERRPRLRIGERAQRVELPPMIEREVRSEIAYATFHNGPDAPPSIHELRRVVSVDGKTIEKTEAARRALVLDARSPDDTVKRRLLADLEKHLISGASLDFSLTLLLFRGRALENYDFEPVVRQAIGEEMCQMWAFRQKTGDAGFTRFAGKRVERQPISGMIWLREKDGLPLRVRLRAEHEGVADDATTDYRPTPRGLLPARVEHRRLAGVIVLAENVFEYPEFRRFSTESGITFTPAEEPPQP
jgi:hypothetical protein